MNKNKLPKPGERFTYNEMKFIYLGEEQGGALAIAATPPEDYVPFDEGGKNDWRSSTLRKRLNGEDLKNFNRGDLLPFTSDLTSDDGLKDYGSAEDYIFLLSCDLYRKYREFFPRYGEWLWTLTPATTLFSPSVWYARDVRVVHPDGTVHRGRAHYSFAVAPACLFNLKIFE